MGVEIVQSARCVSNRRRILDVPKDVVNDVCWEVARVTGAKY